MKDEITIGRCKNCKWNEDGSCMNNGKIHEIGYGFKEETNDHLIYCYDEGGGFWVEDNFGCVHFEKRLT